MVRSLGKQVRDTLVLASLREKIVQHEQIVHSRVKEIVIMQVWWDASYEFYSWHDWALNRGVQRLPSFVKPDNTMHVGLYLGRMILKKILHKGRLAAC